MGRFRVASDYFSNALDAATSCREGIGSPMTGRCTSLVLKVEIIAGTSDEQAAIELQMLSTDMGTMVEAQQRETTMRAFPGQDWQETLRDFQRDERLAGYPQD